MEVGCRVGRQLEEEPFPDSQCDWAHCGLEATLQSNRKRKGLHEHRKYEVSLAIETAAVLPRGGG